MGNVGAYMIAFVEREEMRHSEDQFSKLREFWWNSDFLVLMAKRWNLSSVRTLADIGCGVGHWSIQLFQHLGENATIRGVDLEPDWVTACENNFKNAYPCASPARYSFKHGNAYDIPLEDEQFDIVTCQTLLMHLDDPVKAISEMVRLLRPGGRLICVEPNNFFGYLTNDSTTIDLPISFLVDEYEVWLRYQRGRKSLGLGFNSIGEALPAMFSRIGLDDISVYLSDKTQPLFPPYSDEEQRLSIEEMQRSSKLVDEQKYLDEIIRFVEYSGGREQLVKSWWGNRNKFDEERQKAIKAKLYHRNGGVLFYLVSGAKSLPRQGQV